MKTAPRSKALHIALLVVQILVASVMLWAAFAKLIQPLEELAKMLPWAEEHPSLVLLTGVVDLLGGLGIILPTLLKIQPRLTVFASYGIILLMVVGSIFHVSRGEANLIGFNILLIVLAVFIAWGRSTKGKVVARA